MLPSWQKIIGHERNIGCLKTLLAEDKLPHALLFYGKAGIGKHMVAKALSAAVLCEKKNLCGHCASCQAMAVGSHPDFGEIVPESKGKSAKAIKIEQIRDMQTAVARRPLLSSGRAIIIDEADCLNDTAANSLLKTLEEPAGGTVFILIASSPESLLPTIVSRCLRLSFSPLPREKTAAALTALGLAPAEAEALAAIAGGSLGEAIKLQAGPWRQQLDAAVSFWQQLPRLRQSDVWQHGQSLGALGREELAAQLGYFHMLLRDSLALYSGSEELCNHRLAASLRELLPAYTLPKLFRMASLVRQAQTRLQANVNLQLLMESFIIRLRDVMQGGE